MGRVVAVEMNMNRLLDFYRHLHLLNTNIHMGKENQLHHYLLHSIMLILNGNDGWDFGMSMNL